MVKRIYNYKVQMKHLFSFVFFVFLFMSCRTYIVSLDGDVIKSIPVENGIIKVKSYYTQSFFTIKFEVINIDSIDIIPSNNMFLIDVTSLDSTNIESYQKSGDVYCDSYRSSLKYKFTIVNNGNVYIQKILTPTSYYMQHLKSLSINIDNFFEYKGKPIVLGDIILKINQR